MTFTGAPLSMLVRQLSSGLDVDRPVLDKTGLEGRYDFALNLARQTDAGGARIGGPNGESLFTAVEEQLGLKLEPQKSAIEVFVLDQVDRPSDN